MPEHLGETVHQLAGGERFTDDRGHPGIHRPGIVKIDGAADHYHRRVHQVRIRTNRLAQLQPSHVRHVDIGHDRVRAMLAHRYQGLLAVGGRDNAVTCPVQHSLYDLSNARIVVRGHDQSHVHPFATMIHKPLGRPPGNCQKALNRALISAGEWAIYELRLKYDSDRLRSDGIECVRLLAAGSGCGHCSGSFAADRHGPAGSIPVLPGTRAAMISATVVQWKISGITPTMVP